MSSSVHDDNKKKDILIPGEGPAQGLDHAILNSVIQSVFRNFV